MSDKVKNLKQLQTELDALEASGNLTPERRHELYRAISEAAGEIVKDYNIHITGETRNGHGVVYRGVIKLPDARAPLDWTCYMVDGPPGSQHKTEKLRIDAKGWRKLPEADAIRRVIGEFCSSEWENGSDESPFADSDFKAAVCDTADTLAEYIREYVSEKKRQNTVKIPYYISLPGKGHNYVGDRELAYLGVKRTDKYIVLKAAQVEEFLTEWDNKEQAQQAEQPSEQLTTDENGGLSMEEILGGGQPA